MVRYIYGRNGSGKLSFILDRIREDARVRKNILIIPENETLNVESRVVEEDLSGYTQIVTIPLICKDIFMQCGGMNKKNISTGSKKMIMYSILCEDDKNLTMYGNISKNDSSTVESMLSLHRELIRNNISYEDLSIASGKIEKETKYLSDKLSDLSYIFKRYETIVKERWNDPESDALRASKKDNDLYKDCNVYVYGFSSLEKSELELFKNVFKQAKDIYIVINYDKQKDLNIINFESTSLYKKRFDNLFFELKQKGHDIQFGEDVVLQNDVEHKGDDLSYLAGKLYREDEYDSSCDNIKVYKCNSKFDECSSVCSDICAKIYNSKDDIDNPVRFADIAIVSENMNDYEGIIEPILEKYEIPFNWVDGYDIQDDALMRYIYSVFDCIEYNFRAEHVIKLIKNGYSGFDEYDKDIFEKYVYKWDINGYESYSKEWKNSILGFSVDNSEYVTNTLSIVNKIREKLCGDISTLQKNIKGKLTTKEISVMLYEFLENEGVPNKVIERANALYTDNYAEANRIYNLWKTICANMEDIVITLKEDTKCTIDEYIQLFKLGIKESGRENPKTSIDRVVVGSINRVRPRGIKHLYILGTNEGVFPPEIKDSKYLNDKDKQLLKQKLNIDIENDTQKKTSDELLRFYNTICIPNESLTFTYNEQMTNDGRNEMSSELEYICSKMKGIKIIDFNDVGKERIWRRTQAFESIVYCPDDLKAAIYEYYKDDKENKIEQFKKGNLKVEEYVIDNDISKDFFKSDKISVSYSSLENYLTCEYKYFCDKYLKLLDDEKAKFTKDLAGSLMHSILENAVPKIKELKNEGNNVDENIFKNEITSIIDDQISGFLTEHMYNEKPDYILGLTLERIKESSYRVVKKAKDSMQECDFDPNYYELKISDTPKGMPYTKPFDVGYSEYGGESKKIVLNGSIDRVDVFEHNGQKYIRIVDYKNSDKTFDIVSAKNGTRSQMLIYLYSIAENGIINGKNGDIIINKDEIVPAGIMYATASSKTQEEKEKKPNPNFFILDDDAIINEFEKDENINAKITEKNKQKFTFALDDNENNGFYNIKKSLKETIIQATDSMRAGKADTAKIIKERKGFKDSPCGFCKYKNVCKNGEASKFGLND